MYVAHFYVRVVGFMCDVHVCISERVVGLYVLCVCVVLMYLYR